MWVEMFSIHWVTLKWNVILFVRMWVEIVIRNAITDNRNGHPLREDVSWNIRALEEAMLKIVVLFVRMWVEMSNGELQSNHHKVILFVRMWVEIARLPLMRASSFVILFVRMWVEIYLRTNTYTSFLVILFVRMWVEMMIQKKKERKMSGHPLREDVSWNVRSCI